MVVPWEGSDVFVLVTGIPELYSQIGGARGKQGATTWASEINIQHALGVALDSALQLTELPVPDLDCGILGAGGQGGEDGMEGDTGDGLAVGLEGVSCGRPGEPARGVGVLSHERGGGSTVEFGLQAGIPRL